MGIGALPGRVVAARQQTLMLPSNMPDNYYPDVGESEPAAPETARSGSETALLPKNIVPGEGLEPGDTITLKVVKSYEDEIEVEFVKETEENNEETEQQETPGAPMTAEEEIDEMASEPED